MFNNQQSAVLVWMPWLRPCEGWSANVVEENDMTDGPSTTGCAAEQQLVHQFMPPLPQMLQSRIRLWRVVVVIVDLHHHEMSYRRTPRHLEDILTPVAIHHYMEQNEWECTIRDNKRVVWCVVITIYITSNNNNHTLIIWIIEWDTNIFLGGNRTCCKKRFSCTLES